MSVEAVARKDFQDAVRSRWLLGLSGLLVLLVSAFVFVLRGAEGISTTELLSFVLVQDGLVATLIPLISLVIAYGSIVGERESGSLKLLLSLPHSRADVVFGKVLGRVGAVAVPIGLGFLLPALIAALGPLRLDIGLYVGYLLLVVVLAAAFVGIAVGFSASVSSNRLAVAGAFGIYFVFVPMWEIARLPLQLYLIGTGPPAWVPLAGAELFRALQVFIPTGSFKILANEFVQGTLFATDVEQRWETSGEIAAIATLLTWTLAPPLLGLLRFDDADL